MMHTQSASSSARNQQSEHSVTLSPCHLVTLSSSDEFGCDVAAGLTASPKRLDCRYFYDAEGSALFDAICELPEYYLTRAETAILRAHAGDIAAGFRGDFTLVELGSGSAVKTRLLLDA